MSFYCLCQLNLIWSTLYVINDIIPVFNIPDLTSSAVTSQTTSIPNPIHSGSEAAGGHPPAHQQVLQTAPLTQRPASTFCLRWRSFWFQQIFINFPVQAPSLVGMASLRLLVCSFIICVWSVFFLHCLGQSLLKTLQQRLTRKWR